MLQEAELSGLADSENNLGGSSETMYYIGLDVHKKTISYCVKDAAGCVYQEGRIGSTRHELDAWVKTLPQPRSMAMEATIFSGWIYDHLLPHAGAIKVAHPLMLRAIAAGKKKNDRVDASKIADCLRCDFLPECHMASTAIRDRRRILRYRHLLVKQMVQTKNRVSGLLMETGVEHNKSRLHKVGYFRRLLATSAEIDDSIQPLLRLSRETIERCQKSEYALVSSLERDPLLADRIRRLRTVPGVGPITALSWALEMGDISPQHVEPHPDTHIMPHLSVASSLVCVAERAASFFRIASRFDSFLDMRVELLRDFAVEPIAAKYIKHTREE